MSWRCGEDDRQIAPSCAVPVCRCTYSSANVTVVYLYSLVCYFIYSCPVCCFSISPSFPCQQKWMPALLKASKSRKKSSISNLAERLSAKSFCSKTSTTLSFIDREGSTVYARVSKSKKRAKAGTTYDIIQGTICLKVIL